MEISVIIPTYNEAQHIKTCLLSLTSQSFKIKEIIVVDDGSTDTTCQIISALKSKITNLKILHQNHQGAGAARNRGAKTAKGNILVFVDSDMEFDKHFLKYLTQPIKQNKSKGTFSKNEYIKNWHNPWAKSWNFLIGIPENLGIPKDYPPHAPVFRAILKSEFDRAGGFDSHRGYDDDWSLSEKLNYPASVAKKAVYYHYNPDSFTEIFRQSRWKAKRNYRLGILGKLINLIFRTNFQLWLLNFIKYRQLPPKFFLASVAYYAGTQMGILESIFSSKVSK